MSRQTMLDQLAGRVAALVLPHPARVAVDGVDAAGKTALANELAPLVAARGRSVIRASLDGFHRPRAERYRQGADSAAGYYEDSFDYPALSAALLKPLGPSGTRHYRTATFDFRADAPLALPTEDAAPDAVLLFDGVFLLRPDLDAFWDYRIFVEVPFAVSLWRAMRRDVALFGSARAVAQRYRHRYFPGQRLYLETVHPEQRAQAVVRNADPANPTLTFDV
jgi:uridine kinase